MKWKKKMRGKHFGAFLVSLVLLLVPLSLLSPAETTAINRVKGGIRAIDNGTLKNGDGTNGAEVVLTVRQLQLLKQARTTKGQLLNLDDAVARGQRIYFVILIANDIETKLEDIQLLDDFTEREFDYIPDTLEMVFVENNATSFSKGADDEFWKNAAGWVKVSDPVDDDIASVKTDRQGGVQVYSLHVGKVPNLKPLDIPAKTTWAIRFQVKVRGKGQ